MKREKFGSRMGFILVSAGCAIGLGNVWKFPYANAINDIQSFWYDTNLETLAEMSSDEVFSKLNAIADNNSTNAVQLSIVKNYYIFQASSMFD